MMKILPYKILIVSSLLTVGSANMIAPTAAFASEVGQIAIENAENSDFAANKGVMKETLEKAGKFAQAMNEYSHLLIHNPDVNFEGIEINGHTDLPDKIKQNQVNAREHANYWDTDLKRTLLDTLNNITIYDRTFQNYYDTLIEAIDTEDIDVLKEGITDLQEDIQKNKQVAIKLIEELKTFKQEVGKDSRVFKENKDTLHTVLGSQTGGLDEDERLLQELLKQIKQYKLIQTAGIIGVSSIILFPGPNVAVGGILLIVSTAQLKQLEVLLEPLRQTVDYKKALNRVVTVASNSVDEMHNAISGAVDALEYMHTQWNDLDSQYAGVLKSIDAASEKVTTNKFTFLKPKLKTAKESWDTLHKDADTIKEGIKELKLEPIQQ
ncbi:hemolysin [Bacillus thuringiensis]|uniref:HBL/NHE enterotoxin family protein n=1 Tax=Bacillus thuringiensis TaxID=1428 RepID=UPI00080BBAFF|nr:HBL/NHE enterotoxin family protein [Bacillus thuringiensis]MBH0340633.1 hemolysin [Bacillus thuringiensis]